jgi:NAD-dependent dihydropyrimidine dehydrogenase PreA subunit
MQIMLGIMLLAGAVFFSKLFCGYICPLGTISEFFGKLGDKLKVRIHISEIFDNPLRALKYILLFITFYFTLSSSELFCKKYDPYYAIASGFNADVVLTYAVIAIAILFLGSVFFRLFWCRYLCPLGALTNIFRYSWWFAGILILFLALTFAGIKISFIYLMLALVCTGYILEVIMMNRVRPSMVRITRNAQTCSSCNKCSMSCPQGIDVARMERVDHIDCTLCGDCLYACPEKDAIQINGRNLKWLPGILTAIMIVAGLALGSFIELPTINVKWGTEKQISTAGIFSKEGLKNIKCYGSSTAFANQMNRVEGIYGVSTYVSSHTVKILYDKSIYNDTTLQELLFVPEKRLFSDLPPETDSVLVLSLLVDRFFDPLDASYPAVHSSAKNRSDSLPE